MDEKNPTLEEVPLNAPPPPGAPNRPRQEVPPNLVDPPESTERASRWQSESAFFDRIAEQLSESVAPIDPLMLARYRKARRGWCNKEFRFKLLGDLHGRRVLDVGCGEGSNAVLMAKLGAQVTGIDISPGSIELCNRRAMRNGVEGRTRFICSPLELVDLPAGEFDVIWGDGVLHHLIPELPELLSKLLQWAAPGALFVFSEPMSLSPVIRRLRAKVPIHTNATPDERPLQKPELDLILQVLPDLEMRWFTLFGRLARFVLPDGDFERASFLRRSTVDALWLVDRAILSVPPLGPCGGMSVLYGHAPR